MQLGDRVKDRITGYSGLVWGITRYLHGCDRIHVIPETTDKDGRAQDCCVFDEPQLVLIEAQAYQKANPEEEPKPKKNPGGPAYLNAGKSMSSFKK